MTKSEWELRIHLFGICFTATSLSSAMSRIRKTFPRFRVASCNFRIISKRPTSQGLTSFGSKPVWRADGACTACGWSSSSNATELPPPVAAMLAADAGAPTADELAGR
eukprot:CAMPEP_0171176132 /NCGR_PEP_ID=MMETSP0790-20130122/11579_1 /TAXON_ID=2925 /ORGANISM="Alexandrium catenella, Strain OF101" /LENGTH=107 /DNA_ID=CAMNT_0011641015 /DNA_START=838 /DNA_END=1161 /DNA_ORIENTATION=+